MGLCVRDGSRSAFGGAVAIGSTHVWLHIQKRLFKDPIEQKTLLPLTFGTWLARGDSAATVDTPEEPNRHSLFIHS